MTQTTRYSVQCLPVRAEEGERGWLDVEAESLEQAANEATRGAGRLGMRVGRVRVYPHGTGTSLRAPLFERVVESD